MRLNVVVLTYQSNITEAESSIQSKLLGARLGLSLISTIHYLQESWCEDTEVHYEWVKGHTDDLNRDPTHQIKHHLF
jgi:hypothetical protein